MARSVIAFLYIFVTVPAGLGLQGCSDHHSPVDRSTNGAVEQQIVVLRDKSTLFEPDGTVGRDLADWLGSGTPGIRTFEFGGHQYDGRSIEPTNEARGRLTNLVAMLRASPSVTSRVVGYTDPTSDKVDDALFARARACRLAEIVRSGGIDKSRLSCEGRAGLDTRAPSGPEANEHIVMTFTIAS